MRGGPVGVNRAKIEKAVREILQAIGDNPRRKGLIDTPKRVARLYEEIFAGIGADPKKVLTLNPIEHDEMVLVKNIPLYSVCEHHLLPFYGKVHLAYIPAGNRVTGLSKLARVVDVLAKRPQIQERLTKEIADTLWDTLRPQGTLVVVEAEHLCMIVRGIKKPGSVTVTSAVRGVFRKKTAARMEALSLIKS
jgi:GTP cyclohydrolase I